MPIVVGPSGETVHAEFSSIPGEPFDIGGIAVARKQRVHPRDRGSGVEVAARVEGPCLALPPLKMDVGGDSNGNIHHVDFLRHVLRQVRVEMRQDDLPVRIVRVDQIDDGCQLRRTFVEREVRSVEPAPLLQVSPEFGQETPPRGGVCLRPRHRGKSPHGLKFFAPIGYLGAVPPQHAVGVDALADAPPREPLDMGAEDGEVEFPLIAALAGPRPAHHAGGAERAILQGGRDGLLSRARQQAVGFLKEPVVRVRPTVDRRIGMRIVVQRENPLGVLPQVQREPPAGWIPEVEGQHFQIHREPRVRADPRIVSHG